MAQPQGPPLSSEGAAEEVGIEALPDALLADILALAGPLASVGPVATRVNRRWRRAVFSTAPHHWPTTFVLNGAALLDPTFHPASTQHWLTFHLARLRHLAGHLEALRISGTAYLDLLQLPPGTGGTAGGPGTSSCVVAALLGCCARYATLHELHLSGGPPCQLASQVAAVLPSFTGLSSLALRSLELDRLPAGAPLQGLRELDLSSNRLERLPPELRQLTTLRRLQLGHNELAGLPAGPYLEGLEELNVCFNFLPRLPRCLEGARRLRRLVVGQYAPRFQLTRDDVDATLARMPLLRCLEIRGARREAMGREIWMHLWQRLPRLAQGNEWADW